jgi:beta-lactamase class A
MDFDRRRILVGSGLALALAGCAHRLPRGGENAIGDSLAAIERRAGGRLGAYILDPATGRGAGWRADDRFAQCSSFKLSLAAMILASAERGQVDLAETLHWTEADLLSHSPVTRPATSTGLTVEALARGTLVTSDNPAANILLRRFGGPDALTRFWRSIGDTTSRLDRTEPALNEVPPGSRLDTTTPRAMAQTAASLLLGPALSPASREKLKAWMRETATGLDRIRAGFPAGWDAGDKTGTWTGPERRIYVDVAFGGPTGAVPLIVVAYHETQAPFGVEAGASAAVLAEVGRLAARRVDRG